MKTMSPEEKRAADAFAARNGFSYNSIRLSLGMERNKDLEAHQIAEIYGVRHVAKGSTLEENRRKNEARRLRNAAKRVGR